MKPTLLKYVSVRNYIYCLAVFNALFGASYSLSALHMTHIITVSQSAVFSV